MKCQYASANGQRGRASQRNLGSSITPTSTANVISKHLSRKKDADAYHATVKVDVRKGMHTAPSKSVTVAEAAESWIKRVEANGMQGEGPAERTTIRQYRQHIDLHIVPRLGRVKLAQLTPKSVENFRDGLLKVTRNCPGHWRGKC